MRQSRRSAIIAAKTVRALLHKAAASDPALRAALRDRRLDRALGEIPAEPFILSTKTDPNQLQYFFAGKKATFVHRFPHNVSVGAPGQAVLALSALRLKPGMSVLMVGARGGFWEALIMSILGPRGRLVVVEADGEAARATIRNLRRTHRDGGVLVVPDDYPLRGFPVGAPYHRILISAAIEAPPRPLIAQLRPEGELVAAIEREGGQTLWRYAAGEKAQLLGPIQLPSFLKRDECGLWRLRIGQSGKEGGLRRLDFTLETPGETVAVRARAQLSRSCAEEWRRDLAALLRVDAPSARGQDLRQRRIEKIGRHIWTHLLPREIREKLSRAETARGFIMLCSDEDEVPWELTMVPGTGGARDKHLWERSIVSRRPQASALRLSGGYAWRPLSALLAFTPGRGFGGEAETREVRRILEGAGVGVRVARGRRELDVLLAERRRFDIFHFAGHAEIDPACARHSRLWLDEPITAGELRNSMEGVGGASLAFLNACRCAGGKGKDGFGSLLSVFLDWSETAVGPLWEVCPFGARKVARTFYKRLVEGHYMGHALRAAKGKTRNVYGDRDLTASWAAYVLYGDPARALFPLPD